MKKKEYLFDEYMLTGDESKMLGDNVRVMSEDQIVEEYFDHWLAMMIKASENKNSNAYAILKEKLANICVEDFVVVHYGWEKQ